MKTLSYLLIVFVAIAGCVPEDLLRSEIAPLDLKIIQPNKGKAGDTIALTFEELLLANPSDYTISINDVVVPESNIVSVNMAAAEIRFVIPEGINSGNFKVAYKDFPTAQADENTPPFSYRPTATVTLLAGNINIPDGGYAEGQGVNAAFKFPTGIDFDGTGNLYVADRDNNLIRRVTTSGVAFFLAGDNTTFNPGSNDSNNPIAVRFKKPDDLTFDPGTGKIYIADKDNFVIRSLSTTGASATLAGKAGEPGSADNTTGTAARFYKPVGIAAARQGTIYIVDEDDRRIRSLNITTNQVSTIAGISRDVINECVSIDGQPGEGKLCSPDGLDFSATLNCTFVAENDRIRIVDANGRLSTLEVIKDGVDFGQIADLVLDNFGNIYIADRFKHQIMRIDAISHELTLIAGTGSAGYNSIASGPLTQFKSPNGLAIDKTNNILYVADSGNHAIRKIVIR